MEWHFHGSQYYDCNLFQALNVLIKLNINNQGKNSCRLYCIFHLIILYKMSVSFLLTVMLLSLLIVPLLKPQGRMKIWVMTCFSRFTMWKIIIKSWKLYVRSIKVCMYAYYQSLLPQFLLLPVLLRDEANYCFLF